MHLLPWLLYTHDHSALFIYKRLPFHWIIAEFISVDQGYVSCLFVGKEGLSTFNSEDWSLNKGYQLMTGLCATCGSDSV